MFIVRCVSYMPGWVALSGQWKLYASQLVADWLMKPCQWGRHLCGVDAENSHGIGRQGWSAEILLLTLSLV